MTAQAREKFATQVNSEILRSVRYIAQNEGRQLQALIDEALADLMAAYQASHEKFAPLYKKLAE